MQTQISTINKLPISAGARSGYSNVFELLFPSQSPSTEKTNILPFSYREVDYLMRRQLRSKPRSLLFS